jgi:hypothetical protein
MIRESTEENRKEQSSVDLNRINEEAERLRIEELFKEGDFSYLYQYFVKRGDIDGLRRVADGLREEEREEDAKKVEEKAQSLEKECRPGHRV